MASACWSARSRRSLCVVLWILVIFPAVGCKPPPPPNLQADQAADVRWQGAVVLGSPSLTAGIPGTGPLTIAQVQGWLANPTNHEPLTLALPLGLRTPGSDGVVAREEVTRARIELGRQLFFDKRLSKHESLSCRDCHQPTRQFSSDKISHHSLRETAVIFNRVLGQEQFWDGRAPSLEAQIRFPLENVHELKTTAAECVARIGSIEGYRLQFEANFGQVNFENLCAAIAAFERTLVTGPSPWDYDAELQRLQKLDPQTLSAADQQWLAEVRTAAAAQLLSAAARRGSVLFFSNRTNCSVCHSGPNFTDEQYHDVGLRSRSTSPSPVDQKIAADLGRFKVTQDEADRWAFKTPTLRNVALTWPYFHDGRYHKLSDVVAHFVRGGDGETDAIEPLDLSPAEVQDLVAFLEALTGPLPPVATERLPP
jgi:cytochrome c peroxidase